MHSREVLGRPSGQTWRKPFEHVASAQKGWKVTDTIQSRIAEVVGGFALRDDLESSRLGFPFPLPSCAACQAESPAGSQRRETEQGDLGPSPPCPHLTS